MSKVKIAVLETKIERLVEKQKELTERVRTNEKFIAGVGAIATVAITLLGFVGGADASETTGFPKSGAELIQRMREWESEQNRTPVDEDLNRALAELENEPTEQEELLQLPCDEDQESDRWRHDRCGDRPWLRSEEDGKSPSGGSGHPRKKNP
tara:strand:+ start:5150 stop:5608 length:459 start_codon:yes stop_codon:yes gene_type:complete